MALPKTDSFTTGSDQHLHDYDANWVDNNSAVWSVVASTDDAYQSTSGTGGEGAAHWAGDTFDDNQYAQGKITAVSGNSIGVSVRCSSGSTGTYYGFYCTITDHYLFKLVVGGFTQIGSTDTTNGAVNEIIRLEVSGTSLTPKINGAVWGQGAKTDDAIDSGYAGLTGYSSGTGCRIDDFEGGNLEGGCVEVVVAPQVGTETTTVVIVDDCV